MGFRLASSNRRELLFRFRLRRSLPPAQLRSIARRADKQGVTVNEVFISSRTTRESRLVFTSGTNRVSYKTS